MNRIKIFALIIFVNFIICGTVKGQTPLYVKHADNSIIIPGTLIKEKLKIDKESKGEVDPLSRISMPGYVSVHEPGNMIFVAYSRRNKIEIYDTDLNYVGIVDEKTINYKWPIGVIARKDGNFLITDFGLGSVTWFDNNANKLTEIKIMPFSSFPTAMFNKEGNMVVYKADNDGLFAVYNIKGEKISQFGELLESRYPEQKNNFWNNWFNNVHFTIDNNGYLFCTFIDNPVLRTYDPDGNLVCEVDYWSIPGIKKRYDDWLFEYKTRVEKEIKEGRHNYRGKIFVSNISVDDKYVYIKFNVKYSPIYLFNKEDYTLIKTIELGNSSGVSFNATSKDYIYSSLGEGFLARYKKSK